jgi:EmrB/QacA subfamily drug resistance transporter
MTTSSADRGLDPRRWITLAVVLVSVVVAVLDNTVLNVAIPTILREFHTNLPSLQWVVTGYSLTFATFLIIGGRLGDIYGHRNTFMVGVGLFGLGSLVAALSTSVLTLVIGEAIIEGIGASLMMPSTLAILSTTFTGHERGSAFAAWGAVGGASAAFGPVVGGFLTTNYSWRWAFGLNVIVAPLAILGALLFMRRSTNVRIGGKLDFPGACLIASGMFLIVFGISEGGTYGWWQPVKGMSIADVTLWPTSRPISVTPVLFLLAIAILVTFYVVERRKERRQAWPLFEFGQLRHRGFRYGLITTGMVALSQFGLIFVLPVFLQDAIHLSAWRNGLWQLPTGLFIVTGAQVGGRLTRRFGPTAVARVGIAISASGFTAIALAISPDLTFMKLLPGFALYGVGAGLAQSQLTNVVLSDIDADKAGVASGANTTVRQVGAALGVATMGAVFAAQTIRHAVQNVNASALSPELKRQVIAQVHVHGVSVVAPPDASPQDLASLNHTIAAALTAGARPALFITAIAAGVAALLALLIPSVPALPRTAKSEAVATVDAVQPVAVDPDPVSTPAAAGTE